MNQIPAMLFGTYYEPESGGLSGEHIQLCAEGARRKPNLSGKWTEMLFKSTSFPKAVLYTGLFFILSITEMR